MTWKDVLKNIEFDSAESCCADLKREFIDFVEKLSDYYESIGVKNNMRRHSEIADGLCEDVLYVVEMFLEEAKNPPKGSKMPSWVKGDLQNILDEFEACKDEGTKIKVPILER